MFEKAKERKEKKKETLKRISRLNRYLFPKHFYGVFIMQLINIDDNI